MPLDGTEIQSLWGRWFETRSRDVADRLARHYRPRVLFLAKLLYQRHLPRHVSAEDVASAAIWGLNSAINGCLPEKLGAFGKYLERKVRGAVRDYFRQLDWVPRSERQKQAASNGQYRPARMYPFSQLLIRDSAVCSRMAQIPKPDARLTWEDACIAVDAALNRAVNEGRLWRTYVPAFRRHYFEGEDVADIAATMNVHPGSVRVYLHKCGQAIKGDARLREQLMPGVKAA